MLVLFETAAGYALFKLLDDTVLRNVDDIYKEFSTAEKASDAVKLLSFKKFKDTADALEAATSITEGKLGKTLKKLVKKTVASAEGIENLAVGEDKLGKLIKDKFQVKCIANQATSELMRGIRTHLNSLLEEDDVASSELSAMKLGLAHSLGRYKVKFNPEKIDTMIVQAVSLLDDIDKELNNYAMRCREWYGWHFPELGKLITDHRAYAQVVKAIGIRQRAVDTDLSDILPSELVDQVKSDAEISMGTEISDLDVLNIGQLCDQVLQIGTYRTQLFDYLRNRMTTLAPNVTALLGELVGARLVSKAGSLMALAKYPASTVQILGAEKALFRALKTKKDTPKYGLIYHAQLIGQASTKYKGKMARKLAAKVSLASRIDAIGDDSTASNLGVDCRAHLEIQMKHDQETGTKRISGMGRMQAKHDSYKFKSQVLTYDNAADSTIPSKGQKRTFDDDDDKKDVKKIKTEEDEHNGLEEETNEPTEKRKKKSKKSKKEAEEV